MTIKDDDDENNDDHHHPETKQNKKKFKLKYRHIQIWHAKKKFTTAALGVVEFFFSLINIHQKKTKTTFKWEKKENKTKRKNPINQSVENGGGGGGGETTDDRHTYTSRLQQQQQQIFNSKIKIIHLRQKKKFFFWDQNRSKFFWKFEKVCFRFVKQNKTKQNKS